MSSSKQFSYHEFFKLSLEQYLLVKCAYIKQAIEEAQKKDEKRQIIQDFINEFVTFSKNVIGKNSKNSQIIIAEIIEKMLIVDFSLMRKKEEDFPRDVLNRSYKIMMLSFDRMDLHVLQLFTRLQCLKLMYDYLTTTDKVPKGFNYREKFDKDMTKHLDQIKVYTKMNFSTPSEGDEILQKIFRTLLQNCLSIEFYTFLSNFCIRNELSKEIKKYVRKEYQTLSLKLSGRHTISQNQKTSSLFNFNDENSKSQIKESNAIISNNNSNPPQQIFMDANSQGSENCSRMVDFGDENKKIQGNKNLQSRKQFNSIFLGSKALSAPLQQQTLQNSKIQQQDSNESKTQIQSRILSKSQYLASGMGENSLGILMEEENSNNHSIQYNDNNNKNFIQQNNHQDYNFNSCGIHSEENTQFNLINIKGFANKNMAQLNENNNKNIHNKNQFEFNHKSQISQYSQQNENKKDLNKSTIRQQSTSEISDLQNESRIKSYSMVNDNYPINNNNANNNIASPNQQYLDGDEKNILNKRFSMQSDLSNTKGSQSSLHGNSQLSNSKLQLSNNKRQLSKPVPSGRTMYSVLNKKILRNSQTKVSLPPQKQSSQIRSNSKNNSDYPVNSNSNSHNGTTNILYEAASKILQEKDLKRQNKMKLMSRESNKYEQSDPFTNVTTKPFKTPSNQENFLEGYQHLNNNHQSQMSDDENSLPLMYMWGHN